MRATMQLSLVCSDPTGDSIGARHSTLLKKKKKKKLQVKGLTHLTWIMKHSSQHPKKNDPVLGVRIDFCTFWCMATANHTKPMLYP